MSLEVCQLREEAADGNNHFRRMFAISLYQLIACRSTPGYVDAFRVQTIPYVRGFLYTRPIESALTRFVCGSHI